MAETNLGSSYLILSHSLRISLAEILGTAELLDSGLLSATQKKEINTIRQAGNKLLSIIDQILINEANKTECHHFFNA